MMRMLFLFPQPFSVSGEKQSEILKFLLFMILLVALVIVTYAFFELRHKRSIRKKFRKFADTHRLPQIEMRSMPRISIPESLRVFLTLTGGNFSGLKTQVLDISAAGFAVRPLFPPKKLPLNASFSGGVVHTPINRFTIRKIKSVRLENRLLGQTLGMQIETMDEGELREMIRFIAYLKEFLHHGL
jgi:hypothetical protein